MRLSSFAKIIASFFGISSSRQIYKFLAIKLYNTKWSLDKPFKSYSQFGEDSVIRKYLPENYGCYIDVGSGNPIRGNNTYAFYRLGWKGILIDPISQNVTLAKKLRPNDQIIQALVAFDSIDEVDFFEFTPYEYSTMSVERYNYLMKNEMNFVKSYKVKTLSLVSLRKNVSPNFPSFLSIDAEGSDLEVLKSNNFTLFRPRVICVEDLDLKINGCSEIQTFLQTKGYELKDKTGPSCIYVTNS